MKNYMDDASPEGMERIEQRVQQRLSTMSPADIHLLERTMQNANPSSSFFVVSAFHANQAYTYDVCIITRAFPHTHAVL